MLPTLPVAARRTVEDLLRTPRCDPDELRRQVEAHLVLARALAAERPMVDLSRAEHVARACLALLDDWSRTEPDHQGWVQVACLYFVRTDDDEEDFASIVGFDGDTDVLHYVLERIGRADLKER